MTAAISAAASAAPMGAAARIMRARCGRQWQCADAVAKFRDAARSIDGAEGFERRFRLRCGGCRWRVEPAERCDIGDAPGGAIEDEAGQIGGADFRLGEGGEAGRLRFIPEAIADSGFGSPGATAALVSSCTRDSDRIETCDADVGLIAGDAGLAAVDDDADAFDGQ